MRQPDPTIFALSSGRPPAAIAVVRLSGPGASDAITGLGGKLPEPRKAALRRLRDPQTNAADETLVLWFPPNTETGETWRSCTARRPGDCCCSSISRANVWVSPAEAGEFTRRAFENGRWI